jgi:hypothetical protein
MKTRSVFWGTIFIIAGALLLLGNLGVLTVNIWKLVWPSFIIAMGVWTLWAATRGPEALETEELSLPLEGAASAKLTVAFGAGQFHINGDAHPNELLSGSFVGGVEEKVSQDGDFTKVKLQPRTDDFIHVVMPWSWGARNWNFGLNKDVAWQLKFEMGASDAQVDLTDVRVTDLKVETGASNTEITLPANAGHTHVDLDGGAASVSFTVPEGVAARIQVDSGLSSIDIDRTRFPRVGNYYKSDDYETAANKVDINADFGAGSLSIR